MKKITLFFMSLFLVFGTTMAKDEKDEEVKDFALVAANPNSNIPVANVQIINLEFSKNITIKLPEEKIIIRSEDSKEEFEIVNSMAYDKNAIFYLQNAEQQTYISTPGTYTYTMPAGVIKSVDDEVFPETTFTFTVVGEAFEMVDWSPREAGSVEEIVVTFNKEVTEIKLPASGISIVDNYWMPVKNVSDVIINDDKKSVTLKLESAITTSGKYNIDLYNNVFFSGAESNEYKSISFEVIDLTPSFSTNVQDGDKVKVSEFGNLEISFKNVTEFEMVDGQKITVFLPNRVESVGTVKKQDNKFVVTFDEVDFVEGNYVFTIPAGAFTMDGVANEEGKSISVELYTFKLIPLEVVSVTPVVGEVENITQIVVKFNQYVKLYYKDGVTLSQDIYLTCGDEKFKLTNTGGPFISDELIYSSAEWDGYGYVSNPINAPGTYTLNLGDIIVFHGADDIFESEYYSYADTWHAENASCEGTYSWTIKGDTSVENVPAAEGEQVIYDLLGRRVESITGAGIYIVNGKKVVIK